MTKTEPAAKESTPMDPSTPERPVGEAAQTRSRACHAAKQLVDEVLDLFPETPYQFGKYNNRGVALSVTFVSAETELLKFLPLLTDSRLLHIIGTPADGEVDDGLYEIEAEFRNDARAQDLRESFGLSEAWSVFTGHDPFDPDLIGLAQFDGADPSYGDNTDPTEGGNAAETSADAQDGGGA